MPLPYAIVMARPCTDAPGRYIAESSFGRRLDMPAACKRLKDMPGAKCSESLGVARFDHEGRTIILYRSGRVDLRKVVDESDAQKAMAAVERLLDGAFEGQGGAG